MAKLKPRIVQNPETGRFEEVSDGSYISTPPPEKPKSKRVTKDIIKEYLKRMADFASPGPRTIIQPDGSTVTEWPAPPEAANEANTPLTDTMEALRIAQENFNQSLRAPGRSFEIIDAAAERERFEREQAAEPEQDADYRFVKPTDVKYTPSSEVAEWDTSATIETSSGDLPVAENVTQPLQNAATITIKDSNGAYYTLYLSGGPAVFKVTVLDDQGQARDTMLTTYDTLALTLYPPERGVGVRLRPDQTRPAFEPEPPSPVVPGARLIKVR